MTAPDGPRLFCDVMLGGLARWLRAAGYDVSWRDYIADPELVRLAAAERRILLSSDTGIFKTGIVRDGEVPSLFVPHGLTVSEQLSFALRELKLPVREPRCMGCGGELREVTRESARGRVPERSWARHEQFWECGRCGRTFWRGTHWDRIAEQLRRLGAAPGEPAP
jgi:uncharacterized protein with PIN domain